MQRRFWPLALAAIVSGSLALGIGSPEDVQANGSHASVSDEALVRSLPGFSNGYATVNGVRIHYVIGGKGEAVLLLPGWPETWWAYHKIMPELAKSHRVVSVDLRGMGSSGKPSGGYDKKTMASDLAALSEKLGFNKVDVVGHDIGAMVAFSFAENHPAMVEKLVMLDVPHPNVGLLQLRLLPDFGSFHDTIDPEHPYLWWFAFNQVNGLPEQLLKGRVRFEQAWFFHYMAENERAITPLDREVYALAYSQPGGIRASGAWFQAFGQDIADSKTYGVLKMPVLGLAGPGYIPLKIALDKSAPGSTTVRVPGSGHFIAEEKPDALLSALEEFFKQPKAPSQ